MSALMRRLGVQERKCRGTFGEKREAGRSGELFQYKSFKKKRHL